MPVRTILQFPDPRLRLAARPVQIFGEELAALAADLLDTMRAAPGIGITAPHIGVLERLTVIELDAVAGSRAYVNPKLVFSSPQIASHPEGSVSMPGVTEDVERPTSIRVAYQTLTGEPQEEDAEGLLAVCLQHEIDQLDGVFWIQRLSRLKRERVIKRFDKRNRSGS